MDSGNTEPKMEIAHTVRLFSQSLERWPDEIDMDTAHLNIDHNRLDEVPASIKQLKSLKSFSAVGNDIEFICAEIGVLGALEKLNLTENNLTKVPDEMCCLHKLTTLQLLGNEITHLPADIGSLISLQHLDLSENQIDCLPNSFASLIKLEFLDVSHNDMVALPESFGQLENLKILNLSSNGLRTLPDDFGSLSSLEILDMTSNCLIGLPETFKSSSCIQEIYLDENEVSYLPLWFGDLSSITKLCISANKIAGEALPDCMGNGCPSLEHLDLSGNNITTLPSSFCNLLNLKFFDMGSTLPDLERRVELLNGNLLKTLPLGFGRLCNIVELRLDENHLYELPEDFGDLTSLEILDLGQDSLRILPDSFCKLTKLHTCSLAINCLNELPGEFGNLTNLVSLRLDKNCLKSLPDSFSKLTNLEYLDLFQNKLEEFPPTLNALTNLKSLNVELNKFKTKSAQDIFKVHVYPERDSNLANDWRGKGGTHHRDTEEVQFFGEALSDSSDEDAVEEAAGYSFDAMRREAERRLCMWGKDSEERGITENPENRDHSLGLPATDYTQEIDEAWDSSNNDTHIDANRPHIICAEEDWDACNLDDNPYGTPTMYHHPTKKVHDGFVPAVLHRPSYIVLFHKAASLSVHVEDGQFDDVDTGIV